LALNPKAKSRLTPNSDTRFVSQIKLWRKTIYKIAEGCDARAIWPPHLPASQTLPDQQPGDPIKVDASRTPTAQRRPTKASKRDSGVKTGRKPSSAQATRDAAIQDRLDDGVRPGSTVNWAGFYHDIRVRCGGFVGDPKDEKYKRGFSDVRIRHVTRKLIK